MAALNDIRSGSLSFFGRFTDDLSRDALRPGDFRVRLQATSLVPTTDALYKQDGFFVFQDLRLSAATYELRFESSLYQPRSFLKSLPTVDPVELTYQVEDEIYLAITAVQAGPKRITFRPIPFLPRIAKGSPVRGQGVFSTTLAEDLEGVNVSAAVLSSVTGLAAGQLLRVVRSRALVARPGPYYPFPQTVTLLALKVVSQSPAGPPIVGAKARLQKVNTITPASTAVGGVALFHVTLPGPQGGRLVLGPDRDLETLTDGRGQAVLYLPGHWPLTSVELGLTAAGHQPKTVTLVVVPSQRTTATIDLTPA